MAPVILHQFRMYYQNAPEAQGGKRPIGVLRQRAGKDMLWGRVSAEVEAMLEQGTTQRSRLAGLSKPKLRPHDWKSGDRLWVMRQRASNKVEVIAPFGGHDAMVADLKAKVFPEERLKVLALVKGKKVVRVV